MSESLGRALADAWSRAGARRRRRPGAKGWHAQLSELTRNSPGQAALQQAGVEPGAGARNWRAWLAEDRAPSKANRERIADAYRRWFGPGEQRTPLGDLERRTYAIYGQVDTSDGDDRRRGEGNEPFRVDGRYGNWGRLRQAWLTRASHSDIGEYFIHDIIMDDPNLPFSEYPAIYDVATVEIER